MMACCISRSDGMAKIGADITPTVDQPLPQPLPEDSGRGAHDQPPPVATGGPRGVDQPKMFTMIEPSPHDKATAYVTATALQE